jgi:hypothetical protein
LTSSSFATSKSLNFKKDYTYYECFSLGPADLKYFKSVMMSTSLLPTSYYSLNLKGSCLLGRVFLLSLYEYKFVQSRLHAAIFPPYLILLSSLQNAPDMLPMFSFLHPVDQKLFGANAMPPPSLRSFLKILLKQFQNSCLDCIISSLFSSKTTEVSLYVFCLDLATSRH